MKKSFPLIICVFLLALVPVAGAETISYGSQTLTMGWTAGHFSDVFNLVNSDLRLSYTIDLTGVQASATPYSNYAEVGIRQVGSGDFNPGPWNTYQGGAGGWMVSNVYSVSASPGTQGLSDDHGLQASGGRGWADYDATAAGTVTAPFGTTANYGMWFDRDEVDQWQAALWGAVNGATYNTGGIYDIVITYHAISPTLGTMFATVNGVPTGFYTDGWKNSQPEIYPAGLSFTGDMTQMQVFYGIWGSEGGGLVLLSNIEVSVPEPATLLLLGLGIVGLAGARRFLGSGLEM